MPDWDGVSYDNYDPGMTLPTYKIGDVKAKIDFKLP
jgi:hypothetical protein